MKIILETDRLFLREFVDSDYNDLCEIMQDKEVWNMRQDIYAKMVYIIYRMILL